MGKVWTPPPFCVPEPVGIVTARLIDVSGRVVRAQRTHNFITVDGLKLIVDQLASSPALNPPSHLAVGTGAAQTRDDTTLTNELERNALNAGYPQIDASPDTNILVFAADFSTSEANGSLTEAAVFNASGSPQNMLNYFVFAPAIDKTSSQSLTVTLKMRLGAL